MADKLTPVQFENTPDSAVQQKDQQATKNAINQTISNEKTQTQSSAIILKAADGQSLSLTSTKLESWFATVVKATVGKNALTKPQEQVNDANLASQFLGFYGFQNASDFIKFINSPAGATVKGMVIEELAKLAALEESQIKQAQTEAMRRHAMLAFLLMGLAKHRAAHAKELAMEELAQQQAASKHNTTTSTTDNKAKETELSLRLAMESYLQSAEAIKTKLDSEHQELKVLDDKKLALTSESKAIEAHYDTLNKYSNDMHNFMLALTNNPTATPQQTIPNIAVPYDQHSNALNLWDGQALDSHSKREQFVINSLMQLNTMIAQRDKTVRNNMGNVASSNQPMVDSHFYGLNMFRDQLFKVQLQMSNGLQVVHHNGEFYLISANHQLDDLDVNEKANAKQRYAKEIQSGAPQASQIARDKAEALARQRARQEDLGEQYQRKQAAITFLQNQHKAMMSEHAAAQKRYQEQFGNSPNTAPTPKPTPTSTSTKSKETLTSSYKSMLTYMQRNGVTSHGIKELQNSVVTSNMDVKGKKELEAEINKLQPGKPIPPVTMNNLLRTMEQFGVDSQKPNVTSTTAPSPFSTRPRKG